MTYVEYQGESDLCYEYAFENLGTQLTYVVKDYMDNEFCGLKLMRAGECSDSCEFLYNEITNTLTITGSGTMENFVDGATPWNDKANQTISISISGITSIGFDTIGITVSTLPFENVTSIISKSKFTVS